MLNLLLSIAKQSKDGFFTFCHSFKEQPIITLILSHLHYKLIHFGN